MEHEQRNPFFAWGFLLAGCLSVVIGLLTLFLFGGDALDALLQFVVGLMCFPMAVHYFLPAHRRRAKQWLRATYALIAVVVIGPLSVYRVYTVPKVYAKPLALVMAVVLLIGLGAGFYFKHRRERNRRP